MCFDKKMFSTFEPIEIGKRCSWRTLPLHKSKAKEKWCWKKTYGKELTLTNVLYVLEIRKNLVSGSLLNSHGFWMVFESNKFVLSKIGMYVGKAYMSNGMWKPNVMTIFK